MAMPMDKHSVVKIVNEHEVEMLTRSGWRLREVLQETSIEPFGETVQMMVPGNSYPSSFNQTRGFNVVKNRYLMVQDGSKALAELSDKLRETENITNNACAQRDEAHRLVGERDKEIARLKQDVQHITDTNSRNYKQYTEQKTLNQKMETDIAKIRSAIGELKMKEILAS